MSKPTKAITYTLNGTTGDDTISLLGGHLALNGTPETIPTGATQVTLSGGGGNDTIVTDTPYATGSQPVFYDGGAGTDTLDLSNLNEGVWVRLFAGTRPGSSQPVIATQFTVEYMNVSGGDPNDPNALVTSATDAHNNITNIESVVGTAYNDFLELGNYTGMADGGVGNDRVIGGLGNDQLFGGAGDDFLFGKAGNDLMTGGSGADQFEVVTGNGNDVITDFNMGEGDSLYIGWQTSTDVVPDSSSWYSTSWTDPSGTSHQAIAANFTGGAVTLVDLTLADVFNVMAHTTEFHFLNG